MKLKQKTTTLFRLKSCHKKCIILQNTILQNPVSTVTTYDQGPSCVASGGFCQDLRPNRSITHRLYWCSYLILSLAHVKFYPRDQELFIHKVLCEKRFITP